MGITNIHYPSQLLQRAADRVPFADQAIIQPHRKNVLVVSGPCSQEDVDRYEWCFRTTELGKWITQGSTGEGPQVVTADTGMPVPRITVSPGLARTTVNNQQPLSYVLIIQGTSGAEKLKVVVEDNTDKAATTMMHEALNGFSTVFSAAFVRRYTGPTFVSAIGPLNATHKKVARLSDLDNPTNAVVEFLC